MVAKYSIEPLNKEGCVSTDIPIAPESTIIFAISAGSVLLLIFPWEGEENFISVMSGA
jgi:hypothetical protein